MDVHLQVLQASRTTQLVDYPVLVRGRVRLGTVQDSCNGTVCYLNWDPSVPIERIMYAIHLVPARYHGMFARFDSCSASSLLPGACTHFNARTLFFLV